ncbi:Pentatricopeptide repeat-containing protein, mitochondrial, partial [Mucuna pruriens]
MTLSLRHGHRTRTSSNIGPLTLFLRHQTDSALPHGPRRVFSATELRCLHQRRPQRRGEQVCLPRGSSLPLSRLLRSPLNCAFYHSRCQIPFLLPHSSSCLALQKKLLIPHLGTFSALPFSPFRGKFPFLNSTRAFASDAHSGVEDDDGDRGVSGESCADPEEVDRVCKVIDELFALDRNMEAVLDECEVRLSHDLVVDVLQRFKHARKPAFRFFCWAGKRPGFAHDSRTYNCMMCVLGRTRQFETMVTLLEEMGEKGLLTMETFSVAIKAFAEAKQRKKAVGIFDLMKKYEFKVGVDVINFLLDSLGTAKLGKEAQAVFEKLKDRFTPSLQTYTILLSGWCRLKNLLEAGRVWNLMIDGGFKPDIVAHNVMLEGLLKCKKKSDAIKLFEIMKAKGPLPNIRSYTIMIQDFCKQKMMGEAIEYFDEMVDRQCQPDAVLYTCLIAGFGRQKKMDMVYNLLKEMRERGCLPDGRTYNALIKLMTSQHMPDDAVRIYKKMIQSGIKPTIHTYNMIMKSYFVTKNYEMGHAVWNEMHQKGCCPDDNSYTVFIGGLIRQDRCSEACKYLEEMLEKGMKAPQLDYNKFASDISKTGNAVILEELAKKMNFVGKFEVSNVLASWADMMKKSAKRREPTKSARHLLYSNARTIAGNYPMTICFYISQVANRGVQKLEFSNSSRGSLCFSFLGPSMLQRDSSESSSSSSLFPNLCKPGIIEAKLESLSSSKKTKPRSMNPFSSSNSRSDKLLLCLLFFLSLLVLFFLGNTSCCICASESVTSFPERMVWSFGEKTESGERESSLKHWQTLVLDKNESVWNGVALTRGIKESDWDSLHGSYELMIN